MGDYYNNVHTSAYHPHGNMSSGFSDNSDSFESELSENPEDMFL